MKPPSTPQPIATRRSPLALAQARDVQTRLIAACGLDAEEGERLFPILGLVSTGDRIQDRTLLEAGGKGLFTKEIDEAQLAGEATFAVHSMKDVPTELPEGLALGAILEREDPRDMLLARGGETRLADLPEGVTIGTASLRRQAQLLACPPGPDRRAPARQCRYPAWPAARWRDSTRAFLARAGLNRLGRDEAQRAPLAMDEMLPAAAQAGRRCGGPHG